jgi:hypothetical protein
MGSDATTLQRSSETMSAAAPVRPTDTEIAAVAYRLWLDKGCPVGSDQEDWLQAEAMLKNALVAKCENVSRLPSISRSDTRTESEVRCQFHWEGHWEVWEMEWETAHWVWD